MISSFQVIENEINAINHYIILFCTHKYALFSSTKHNAVMKIFHSFNFNLI